MILEDFKDMKFDLEEDSLALKRLVAVYNPENFLTDIAQLAILEANPRIALYPFQGFDSPFRQLAYLASLNVSSDTAEIKKDIVQTNAEWKDIVMRSIQVRAGYYQELMPIEKDNEDEFYELYKVSMPVFNNYFDTSSVDFEEQELNKIIDLFSPFNSLIKNITGLEVMDFINIYNLIDCQISNRIKSSINKLVKAEAVKHEIKKNNGIHPRYWNYKGTDSDILDVIEYFSNNSLKFTFKINDIHALYDDNKIKLFLQIFSLIRTKDDEYKFYTQPNKMLLKPMYKISEDQYLVVFLKQISHSIFRCLLSIMASSDKCESFYTHRGKWLQTKTVNLLQSYFKSEANIFNEYSVHGNGQDVLLLSENLGLALIIENKAHNEVPFSGVPNVRVIYQLYYSRFKDSIQKGYDQCWRIKNLFYTVHEFDVLSKNGNFLFNVQTKIFCNVFSIILTLDNFRNPHSSAP